MNWRKCADKRDVDGGKENLLAKALCSVVLELLVEVVSLARRWDVVTVPPGVACCHAETCALLLLAGKFFACPRLLLSGFAYPPLSR